MTLQVRPYSLAGNPGILGVVGWLGPAKFLAVVAGNEEIEYNY